MKGGGNRGKSKSKVSEERKMFTGENSEAVRNEIKKEKKRGGNIIGLSEPQPRRELQQRTGINSTHIVQGSGMKRSKGAKKKKSSLSARSYSYVLKGRGEKVRGECPIVSIKLSILGWNK